MAKKWFSIFLLGLVFLLAKTAECSAEPTYTYVKHVKLIIGERAAEVNYQPKTMAQAAYEKDGRTLVPFRFLGESLGATIAWDAGHKQAKLTLGENKVAVTVGSRAAYVNDKLTSLDVPAESTNGSLFVPLRFMSESLGASVDYDADTKTITIDHINTDEWVWYTTPGSKLKYKHPKAWTVRSVDSDNMVVFISPNKTELFCYWTEKTPEENYAALKQLADEKGWTFEGEYLNGKDLDQGYELQFSRYDVEKNGSIWYICYVEPFQKGNSLLGEVIMDENVFGLDNNVAYEILES